MEIKSRKMSKTEKMQKMCILLGVIIIIIVLVFMPNGFISAINAIKMKQLSVWELMIMSFLSFVPTVLPFSFAKSKISSISQ